jgi:hypothetical protein
MRSIASRRSARFLVVLSLCYITQEERRSPLETWHSMSERSDGVAREPRRSRSILHACGSEGGTSMFRVRASEVQTRVPATAIVIVLALLLAFALSAAASGQCSHRHFGHAVGHAEPDYRRHLGIAARGNRCQEGYCFATTRNDDHSGHGPSHSPSPPTGSVSSADH